MTTSGLILFAFTALALFAVTACAESDGAPESRVVTASVTPSPLASGREVTLSVGNQRVATFPDEAAAAIAASTRAGFTVRPLTALPARFRVIAFDVFAPLQPGGPTIVQVLVTGSSGGLVVQQVTGLGAGEPPENGQSLPAAKPGATYWSVPAATGAVYVAVAPGRTASVVVKDTAVITQAEALALLADLV